MEGDPISSALTRKKAPASFVYTSMRKQKRRFVFLCSLSFPAHIHQYPAQVLGGRFRNVMPSDLFAPGSMAVMSLPSAGARYAGEASRDKLRQMYRR